MFLRAEAYVHLQNNFSEWLMSITKRSRADHKRKVSFRQRQVENEVKEPYENC